MITFWILSRLCSSGRKCTKLPVLTEAVNSNSDSISFRCPSKPGHPSMHNYQCPSLAHQHLSWMEPLVAPVFDKVRMCAVKRSRGERCQRCGSIMRLECEGGGCSNFSCCQLTITAHGYLSPPRWGTSWQYVLWSQKRKHSHSESCSLRDCPSSVSAACVFYCLVDQAEHEAANLKPIKGSLFFPDGRLRCWPWTAASPVCVNAFCCQRLIFFVTAVSSQIKGIKHPPRYTEKQQGHFWLESSFRKLWKKKE